MNSRPESQAHPRAVRCSLLGGQVRFDTFDGSAQNLFKPKLALVAASCRWTSGPRRTR